MGTVSNPATMSSIKAAWAAAQNNFASFYRGGPVVNIGDSTNIPTSASGMRMSQFNGVAAQHTTTFNTTAPASRTTTTTFLTTVLVCLVKGTIVNLPDGRSVPVEQLKVGDSVLSIDLPGLDPETKDILAYRYYVTKRLEKARLVETKIKAIRASHSEFLVSIWFDGQDRPLRVTPSHPLFVYDTKDQRFKFITAAAIDYSYKLLDRYFRLSSINDIALMEGDFTIYKVDCDPYDVFFHEGVLGHNMKLSSHDSSYYTSASTVTSWTTTFATSTVTFG